MPTSPQERILDRSLVSENRELEELLDDLAGLIDEVVNFGTHVFTWCLESGADHKDAILPLTLPLRHSLQMFDSISALIRQASIEPCDVHLRSALESCFTIRYILQSDTKKRAMAFLVWHAHRRLKLYRKYDPSKEMGKQLAAQLEGSPVEGLGNAIAGKFDLEQARSNISDLLQRDLYKDAEEEYQRLRGQGTSNPSWFQFYDGPDNLEQLARCIGKESWYQTLYRQWSDSIHATQVVRTMIEVDGEAAIRTLRNPLDVESRVTLAVTLALQIYQPMIKSMAPAKAAVYDQWFQKEVQDRYMQVAKKKLISLDS